MDENGMDEKRLKCGRDKNGLIFFKDENKEGTKWNGQKYNENAKRIKVD